MGKRRYRPPGITTTPDGERRRYQVCAPCWKLRNGPGIIPHVLGAAQKDFYETPCALCGQVTSSAHFMPLLDREVHARVPIRYLDGPRAGHPGGLVNLRVTVHRTYDGDGRAVDYACELVGAVMLARVIPESMDGQSRLRE